MCPLGYISQTNVFLKKYWPQKFTFSKAAGHLKQTRPWAFFSSDVFAKYYRAVILPHTLHKKTVNENFRIY